MFLNKKVSSFFALSIIFLLGFIMAAVILWQSHELTELEKPFPLLINIR